MKGGLAGLWRLWESSSPKERPLVIRGNASSGHDALLCQCEEHAQEDVFRLRQTKGIKSLLSGSYPFRMS